MVVFLVKKGIWILIIGCIVIGIGFAIANNNEEGMRVRIIANSNSDIDKKEKEVVKKELEEILNEIENLDVELIRQELNNRLNDELATKIKVEVVNSYYEAKTYENKFIASGSYKTLLITIGEGKGNNFWTLLYPEYYHVEFEESNEVEYHVYIVDLIKKFLTSDS